jgi:tripartite-type tricarboxylate transporter receptor subunit TctC
MFFKPKLKDAVVTMPSVIGRLLKSIYSISFLMLALLLSVYGSRSEAQIDKPMRLMVGFPAGGGTDALARLLAARLSTELGVSVVVENKPGAGGQIAAQYLKSVGSDGYTLFLSHDHTISILPLVMKTPGFDVEADFVAVAGVASFVNAFALSSGTSAQGFNDYINLVKSKPGKKGSVGIPAPASTLEFLVKTLAKRYELDLLSVPYKGSAPMMADMLGNQIEAGSASVPDFIEFHQAKKLRIVAVMGATRQASLPDVPTFKELGINGFEDLPFYGVFAAKDAPPAILNQVSKALEKVVAKPDVKEQFASMGLSPDYLTASQLHTRERSYSSAWAKIIKESGYQPN